MSDLPHRPGTNDDTGRPEPDSPPRMPRWVWLSAIVVAILIALAVVVMLVGGGQHGPARHTSFGGTSIFSTSVDSGTALASARA